MRWDAPICVRHFSRDLVIVAQTSIIRHGFWEIVPSRLVVRWHGTIVKGVDWTKQSTPEVKLHCEAIITRVAYQETMAKERYHPAEGDPPDADLSWVSGFVPRCSISGAVLRANFNMVRDSRRGRGAAFVYRVGSSV